MTREVLCCKKVNSGLLATAICVVAVAASASVFDDVKVWYKGAAGNEAGAADSGGASGWSGDISKLKSLTGDGAYDGGQYFWWGYRLQYKNVPVKLPYANLDIGEAPCVEFPGLDGAGSNKSSGSATVTIGGQEVERPVQYYKCGSMKTKDWLPDWPDGSVCSNYTCVTRFNPYHAINPVSGNPMTLLGLDAIYQGGDKPSGVSLSLNTYKTLDDHLSLRMFVGDRQFNYDSRSSADRVVLIKEGSWVDLALVVASPKLTIYMCYEDGGTNVIRSFSETFDASAAKPALPASKREFRIGSSNSDVYGCTFTNGVYVASGFRNDFWGAFHQIAFWDRALSLDEVKEAMGRPAMVSVGLRGNPGNAEFSAKTASVATEGAWERLNPVLTESKPSATITFQCSKQWDGLPQFLRIAACSDSDTGFVSVAVNGRDIGQVELKPGKISDLYVAEGMVVEGENSLALTRSSGEMLKLDQVEMGGSWRYGIDVASKGIGYFGYDANNFDSYDFNPACGNDVFHERGMASNGAKPRYAFTVNVPEELAGQCRGKLRFRAQNSGGNTYSNEVYVNSARLTGVMMKGGQVYDFTVPSTMLKAGRNEIQLKQITGWINWDCHEFKIYPHTGFFMIVR